MHMNANIEQVSKCINTVVGLKCLKSKPVYLLRNVKSISASILSNKLNNETFVNM